MKLTDWYPGDVKPVRKGVYLTNVRGVRFSTYQYWNGAFWGLWASGPGPSYAYSAQNKPSGHQNPRWRGLAEEPK